MRATGSNIKMSRAQGINTDFNKIFGLVLSNGIVALSGSLLAQYSGSADINSGRGAIVIGLAAVIIGEAIISKISKELFHTSNRRCAGRRGLLHSVSGCHLPQDRH